MSLDYFSPDMLIDNDGTTIIYERLQAILLPKMFDIVHVFYCGFYLFSD